MLIRILVTILIIAGVVLAGGFVLPRDVHVERSLEISRSPSLVYPLLNDFRHFQQWSPWAAKDPDARYEFSGSDSGVGARLSWWGDPRAVGTGWQEITLSQPNTLVRTHLFFAGQGQADAYFDIRPVPDGSLVEWGFDTDMAAGKDFFSGMFAKYMGLFMDRWVGQDYSEGLARFKDYAESFPDVDFSDFEIEITEVQPENILFVSSSSGTSDDAIAKALGAAFGEISRFMASRGLSSSGMPMSISYSRDDRSYEFNAAIPIASAEVTPSGSVNVGQSPSGRVLRAVHQGPYSGLSDTYEKIDTYIAAHRLEREDVSWEHYISDPGDTRESDLITHIYVKLAD